VPTAHWLALRDRTEVFAQLIGDFQRAVGNGVAQFPWSITPYPISAGIYVGIRWHMTVDAASNLPYGRPEVDSLFRAFFWRNALTGRYDQGFLTKLGTDLRRLLDILRDRQSSPSLKAWERSAQTALDDYIEDEVSQEDVYRWLGDGRTLGARQKACALPMRVQVETDLLAPSTRLAYPDLLADLHHVYPRSWCENNHHGALMDYVRNAPDRDPINATANLLPLSRASNLIWRARHPAAVIAAHAITYDSHREVLQAAFIDEECFEILSDGSASPGDFWDRRIELMGADLLARTRVRVPNA